MKSITANNERNVLIITETASGEMFVKELESQSWWKIPTEKSPVDIERLQEDCKAICARTGHTSYVEYIGIHDTSDILLSDERYRRFIGEYPIGRFNAGTSGLEIDAWFAGPDNLCLFGMEERIAELPQVISRFHSETTRILRTLIGEANELKKTGNKSAWFFRAGIADTIQNARFHGLRHEADNTPIWFQKSVWEVLAQLCRRSRPKDPSDVLWLYVAAYEFAGVYLPVPDEIIEGVKDNPRLLDVVCDHASKMVQAGWTSDDKPEVMQMCRN